MPEAPDLQVVKEVLQRRLVGQRVTAAQVLNAIVLRSLAVQDFPVDIVRRELTAVQRKGKFLLLELSAKRSLVINPMLTGALRVCPPGERLLKQVALILSLDSGEQLRYLDETQMGKVFYVTPEQLGAIPGLAQLGPDVLDEPISFEEYCARLRRFHGEIKGILTRGGLVSGIGNAYADEILFDARLYPFRKRRTLSREEMSRLYDATYRVPQEAVQVLRERMGEETHLKVRDFLQAHNKGTQPCPRCGGHLTTIGANQRITTYCRRCQPGMLLQR
ncbi:MAG: Fpg/Nei family DNA glycosylase [Dehalococcoidia bacterium]